MKKFYIISIALFTIHIVNVLGVKAQLQLEATSNTWTQKADFPGIPRHGVVAFAMGDKAFVGTGYHDPAIPYGMQDFWKWDQNSNAWTQVASLPGPARSRSGCFTIDSIGYLVSGSDGYDMNDMWGYNSTTNTWAQMASFPGPSRAQDGIMGTSGNIGTRGYFGLGLNYSSTYFYNDFWEWDQGTNTWTQKANYPGGAIREMAGFTIGTKFYTGTGMDSNGNLYNDFWEWDQGTNTWTQKANFPGGARVGSVSFSTGTKGYIGLGYNPNGFFKDFWEYNPTSDTWVRKIDYSGSGWNYCVGFSIGTKAYIGLGCDAIGNDYNDFWEYDLSASSGVNDHVTLSNFHIYPNPFSDFTIIEYELEESLTVNLTLYNHLGEEVAVLVNEQQDKGEHEVTWNAEELLPGIYFYRLMAGSRSFTGKMVVVR